jgi:hypothetical protein
MQEPAPHESPILVPNLVILALVGVAVANMMVGPLGPHIAACFCPVSLPNGPPVVCPCAQAQNLPWLGLSQVPLTAFVERYPVLSIALLLMSLLLAGGGVYLARTAPGKLPVAGVQVLRLFPLITLAVVGAIACILAATQ